MKYNRKQIIVLIFALTVLLTAAIMLPIFASAATPTSYLNNKTVNFENFGLGEPSTTIKSYLGVDQALPSTAVVVKDPMDPNNGNQAVKITSGTVDADAVKEATSGGSNVDRNLCAPNQELRYDNQKKVVMQVSYYVSEDASGTFQSQMINYSYNGTSKTFLDFYRINMAVGTITTECFGAKAQTHAFPKGVWNTISMVIDLVSGNVNFYINNVLVQSGALSFGSDDSVVNLTNIVFNAKNWNIAKLNKASGAVESYAGYYCVDNALCHSYSSDMETVVNATGTDNMSVAVTNINGSTHYVAIGSTVLLNESVSKSIIDLPANIMDSVIAPVPGASIRLSDSSGIRFATQLSTSKLNTLLEMKEAGSISGVEIGTIISPREIVEAAGAFTVDALEAIKGSTYPATYIEIPATIGKYYTVKGTTLSSGFDKTYVGSIVDIHPGNLSRDFAAIGYIKITKTNGEKLYAYSYDYSSATIGNYSRSIATVASSFVNDPDFAEYKTLLQSLAAGANTNVTVSGSLINTVQKSANALFFKNAAGIANRLTYDGNNGWRLQSVKPTTSNPYNCFENMGAAQSLAVYMGESYTTPMKNITVTTSGTDLKITAEGTDTYVLIATSGSFNIRFMSASGVVMNNVNSIALSGSDIKLSGSLLTGEAIYGGGERFDAANKRGKSLNLFSYDAYNTGSGEGTYMVIPLFTSSRGSGFFVNRYEPMVADFGKTSSSKWTLTIENELSDIYFYATGNITDPIKGYTDLSGHASMPEEWAQGVLVCRYHPDFATLDGEVYDTLTDIPGYDTLYMDANQNTKATDYKGTFTDGTYLYQDKTQKHVYYNGQFYRIAKGSPSGAGVKTIVENLIAAGMTPTAVILEGVNYDNISNGSPSATVNLNKFTQIVNYLQEQDIKVMLYMGVASLSNNMLGYKPEYHLRANVITTDKSGNVISQQLATHQIPKADTVNPDAIDTATQSYLDITNPEAVEWHINSVWGFLAKLGVDGVKIDFCETMPNEGSFTASSGTVTVDYLWYDDSVFDDKDIHHAYSTYYISAFYKKMNELKAEKNIPDGFVVLSRGGGIGSQRNPYMWAGDQTRTEANLATQLLAVINSGISGVPFITYDMAGYAYGSNGYFTSGMKETESKIFARAIQYTVFGNSIQTHGDVRHVYEMTQETQDIAIAYTKLHDELMPYIRKLSQYACDTGIPMIRHMVLQYQNDTNVYEINDQFMLGDALLVAPILSITNNTRSVYIPQGEWIDLLTGERFTVGASGTTRTVTATMEEIPVYLNVNSDDAYALAAVFNGATWQEINGGDMIPLKLTNPPDDAFGEDIFN